MSASSATQRLHATIVGEGATTVVLVNGLGATQDMWRHIVHALQSRARIVRFSFVGTVPGAPTDYLPELYESLHGYADDLLALLEELDIRNALLVGQSVGGIIGLMAAVAAPKRIARVVAFCSSSRYLDDIGYVGGFTRDALDNTLASAAADYVGWARQFAELAIGPDATPEAQTEFADALSGLPSDVGLRMARTIFHCDQRALLPRVMQPVTVLQPREDAAVPMSASEYLVQHLPNAEFVLLPMRGHLPHFTTPTLVLSALDRVLRA